MAGFWGVVVGGFWWWFFFFFWVGCFFGGAGAGEVTTKFKLKPHMKKY